MPTAPLSDLIDAIAVDLAANVTLPAHSVWKYVDPPQIRPDLGSMLGIFPRTVEYEILATTNAYQDDDSIIVAWYVPMIAGVETGGAGNPAVAKAALADAESIISQLRSYATAVPGWSPESEATLTSARFGTLVGSTVWCAEITIKVTHWPNTP